MFGKITSDFMAHQPLQVIQCQIHFHTYKQFYFKQFSLALVNSLIVYDISLSSNPVQPNSSNSNNLVQYKHSFCLHTVKQQNSSISNNSVQPKYSFNVKNSSISNNSVQHTKTVLFQAIQFSISTQFKYQSSSISSNLVQHKYADQFYQQIIVREFASH